MFRHTKVPTNTVKKSTMALHTALNGGVFLRKKTTNTLPQKIIFTVMSVGVMSGGYDSRKKFITFVSVNIRPSPALDKKKNKIFKKNLNKKKTPPPKLQKNLDKNKFGLVKKKSYILLYKKKRWSGKKKVEWNTTLPTTYYNSIPHTIYSI